ncbi:hypothetical protein RKD23_000969 [Streptomyces sp. SAI-170]
MHRRSLSKAWRAPLLLYSHGCLRRSHPHGTQGRRAPRAVSPRPLLDEERTAERESERARARLLLDVLTPIVKAWPSQCLAANDLAIQVHGGYGCTREYNVEQFCRDNRLNPIHEGTHGIHGLALLGRRVVLNVLGQPFGHAMGLPGDHVVIALTRRPSSPPYVRP